MVKVMAKESPIRRYRHRIFNGEGDLTSDTARTPLAASRFKKFTNKIGPVASSILQKIIETVLTEAAKKSIGL